MRNRWMWRTGFQTTVIITIQQLVRSGCVHDIICLREKEDRCMKDIYKPLIKDLMNERMDKIVIQRKKFRKADKRYNEAIKR